LGCGSDRTQNIQIGAARAYRLSEQVAAHSGGTVRDRRRLVGYGL
jgi:hypothetical protein